MRRPLVGSLACALVVLAIACKDKEERPPLQMNGTSTPPSGAGSSSSGASSGTSGTSGAVDGGGECNDVVLSTAFIDQIAVPGEPPPFVGGTLGDGTYELTGSQIYVGSTGSGPTGVAFRETVVVNGQTLEDVAQVQQPGDGGAPVTEAVTRTTLEAIASGTTLAVTASCPVQSTEKALAYTATASQLILYDTSSRTQSTFTRR